MGDSAAWYRFTGLQLDELPDSSCRTDSIWGTNDNEDAVSGDILTIDGTEFVMISSPMGEEPNYLFLRNNRSFTFFAYSRWGDHSEGGYEFDVFLDPFRPEEQELANQRDAKILKIAQDKFGGTIKIVEGWFDSLTDGSEGEEAAFHTIRGGIELDLKTIANEAQIVAIDEAWNALWDPAAKEDSEKGPFYLLRRAIPRPDPDAPWICVSCFNPAVGGFGQYDRYCEHCKKNVAAFRTDLWIDHPPVAHNKG